MSERFISGSRSTHFQPCFLYLPIMLLVLAVHAVLEVSATVPFAIIMLR